ncbi:C40 family peptidase [Shigella sonnei]
MKVKNAASGTLADAHKAKVQKATKVAMNKLMQQIGKPYRWGGSSPRTGFDCSGLVYYAYKDLVKIRIPRTANEMYHLRDAAPIERSELKNGDLVFPYSGTRYSRSRRRDVGNGKFIQSPRTARKFKSLLSVKTTGSATMLALAG